MPTLSDFRRWLQGENVPGFPTWKRWSNAKQEDEGPAVIDTRKSKLNLGKASEEAKKASSGRYSIALDGRDATLHFGKYSGMSLKEIVSTSGGQSYLRWVLGQGFPEELKKVVKEVLG